MRQILLKTATGLSVLLMLLLGLTAWHHPLGLPLLPAGLPALVAGIWPIPALGLVLGLSLRGSLRARLLWLGLLAFVLYTSAFAVFDVAAGPTRLLVILTFATAVYALIFGFASLNLDALASRFHLRTPARRISGYMLIWALALTGLWWWHALWPDTGGQLPPQFRSQPSHATPIMLSLTLMIPAIYISAWLLWFRRTWGFVLASVMNLQGSLFSLLMCLGSLNAQVPGQFVTRESLFWLGFGIACGFSSLQLLRNMALDSPATTPKT